MNRFAYLAAGVSLFLALESCAAHSGQSVPIAQQGVTLADLKRLAAKVAVATLAKVGQRLDAPQGVAIPNYLMNAVAALSASLRKPAAVATSESANLVAVPGVPVLKSSARRTPTFVGGTSPGGGLCYYEMFYHYEDGQMVVDEVDFLGCDDGYVPPGDGGGSNPAPTPTPAPKPSGYTDGCNNPNSTSQQNIANTAAQAMQHNFHEAQANHKEYAGFIARNQATGYLSSIGSTYTPRVDGTFDLGAPPSIEGYDIVAWFHTHDTDYSQTDNPAGIETQPTIQGVAATGNIFSSSDETYSNSNGLDGFVAEQVAANPLAPSTGSTIKWAEWTHGGTIGQQANFSLQGTNLDTWGGC